MNFEDTQDQMLDYSKVSQTEIFLTDAEMTKIKDEIQIALMLDFGITLDDNAGALAWIEKYAKNFSDYIHEHRDIPTMWLDETKKSQVLEMLIQAEKDGFTRQERDVA
jgi:hypothetical protein